MNREDPTIPDGWERVQSEEMIAAGDWYWHPWRQKWAENLQHNICTAGDYEKHGATVIRKKEITQ